MCFRVDRLYPVSMTQGGGASDASRRGLVGSGRLARSASPRSSAVSAAAASGQHPAVSAHSGQHPAVSTPRPSRSARPPASAARAAALVRLRSAAAREGRGAARGRSSCSGPRAPSGRCSCSGTRAPSGASDYARAPTDQCMSKPVRFRRSRRRGTRLLSIRSVVVQFGRYRRRATRRPSSRVRA